MTYSAQQRREKVLSQGYERGHVTVKELAAEIHVSEATIRRDLKALADQGQLDLVYGGATIPRKSDFSFQSKSIRQAEAKRIIGELASRLVADGDQIFLDSGTSCSQMAAFLKRKRGLFVIVNSARLVAELASAPGINLILLGGHYRSDRMDTIGPLATSTLDQLRGYTAFIGADGLSMDFGLTACDIESAHLYRLAVRNAREAVLLVDHTKFLTPSLFKIVDWDAISRLVTDQAPPPEWGEFLSTRGIQALWPHAPVAAGAADSQEHAGPSST